MKEERVILVDEDDVERGSAEKLRAHQDGALHRAFSILVFNRGGELLLQRRAAEKYHSPGLWTNTCCGHPRPGEDTAAAARRRLREEMGFECELQPLCGVRYRADVGAGLVENEYDHVFVGRYDGPPHPDPGEVQAWRWARVDGIRREVAAGADGFTAWFPHLLDRLS